MGATSPSDSVRHQGLVRPWRRADGRSVVTARVAWLAPLLLWGAGCGESPAWHNRPTSDPHTSRIGPPAAAEVARNEAPAATAAAPTAPAATPAAASPAAPAAVTAGARLYTQYCAACHGENGDGDGTAARYLYPKPRNFRDGHYRLVSTVNHVPTDDDLMRVVTRGMPGSAMLPVAAHLSEADRKALVAHVRELTRQGIEARARKDAAEFGEELTPEDLQKQFATHATPGALLAVPADLPPQSAESVARGRALYVSGCATCHGDTGKGDGVQEQRDELGYPIRPRDLTRGIFKGPRTREALYARMALGIPGTPMPASPNLKPVDIGDLVNYIQSLSDVSISSRSEHKRAQLTARRAGATLPEVVPDAAWQAVPPTDLIVSPLWWRDHDDPDLKVQALHDGTSLALRLSWRDATRNDQSGRVLDFPDMAAVELFRGAVEPFLGMGDAEGAVDVWLWNGAAQADRANYADVDTAYPNMIVDMYPFETPGDGPRAHPTDRQPREFLTAWAAGNLRSDPTRPADASNIQAKGFGSTTMRPKTSQVVQARGDYKDGRWTVVLRRPLQVAKEAGLPVASGEKVSVAFALWEGSVHDRNGQKMVSIWHDLTIE